MVGRVFIERIMIFLRLCFGRGWRDFSSIYGYLISFWLYCLRRAKENPNTNEGELLRRPKDRNELRKEVFAALFSAAEKSDGFPEITVKTEWRSNALGKVVSEPPEELVPEYKANVVHWQQDDQTCMCSYINYIGWICECVHFCVYTHFCIYAY